MRQQGILKPGTRDKKVRRLSKIIQAGIKEEPPEAFSIIFLKCTNSTTPSEVGESIKALFDLYENLRKGLINDLADWNDLQSNTLSFIIGYGKKIFELPGLKFGYPQEFNLLPDFNKPRAKRRTAIWDGSGINYSNVKENRADSDIVFRFLSSRESDTKRTIVETWKYFYNLKMDGKHVPLEISGYYNGFLRQDKRNMLDFLDGISNLTSEERENLVFRESSKYPMASRRGGR